MTPERDAGRATRSRIPLRRSTGRPAVHLAARTCAAHCLGNA
jgi:hypothetical protein